MVPNRQADQNKQAGLERNATLLVYLLSKSIREQGAGGKKSEKSKQACSFARTSE